MLDSQYTTDDIAFIARQRKVGKCENQCAFDDGAVKDVVEVWEVEEFDARVCELECGGFAADMG